MFLTLNFRQGTRYNFGFRLVVTWVFPVTAGTFAFPVLQDYRDDIKDGLFGVVFSAIFVAGFNYFGTETCLIFRGR